jgi:nucleotide-binding universal stress UspA family protein
MRTLQSILLATDFRPASDDALNAAAQLATMFGSHVSVLHVVEPAGAAAELYGLQCGETFMQPVLQNLAGKQVTVAQSAVKSGSPANAIVNVAQEWNIDLIVLGAGERKQQDGFSIGPIAESVITHAPQPVLAVRPGDSQTGFKRILCPVDQSSTSARGLRNAVRLAKVFGGEIIVLSVVPEVSWLTAAVETSEVVDAKGEYATEWVQEFERFLGAVDLSGVPWKREVRYGVPHEQIVAAAKEHGVDLIIMGATGRTGLVQVLLGSTTRRLLRGLPCSLLTVKQEDLVEELFESDVRVMALLMAEAQALFDAGTYLPAIAKYRQVLSRNPFHLAAMEGLVSAHEKIGETVEADKYRRRLASSRRVAEPCLDSPDVSF